nr:hypothetical protein [uncultured Rhodopila sp.]
MSTAELHGRRLVQDQMNGVVVQAINQARIHNELVGLATQDAAFETAVKQVEKVREFLETPQRILGNVLTKHGEIAEQVEVGIRNARQALAQDTMTATFDGVPRTGPVDYLINGTGVQSKFINGIPSNLRHVLDHLDTYRNFTTDGSYYVIPKQTYENIQKILEGGHINGLRGSTEENIKALVRQIEEKTGKKFNEVVQSSVVNYPDVQKEAVSNTLDTEQEQLSQKNKEIKDRISEDHKPSLEGAAGAALAGGAVGGTLCMATALYAKYKAGKNVFRGDFTADDWRSVGIESAKGAAVGAVAAGSIYLMTNYAGMAAPFASAVVSAAKGVSSLVSQYYTGTITFNEFMDLGMIVCAESAIVGVSTAAGQALIPIPILGAVVGSLAGKMLAEFATGKTEEVAQRLQDEMQAFKAKLDGTLTSVLDAITAEFDRIASLTEAAFNFKLNTRLVDRSVELARVYGVGEDKIIADEGTLDRYMLT